jgi:HSP20 family protein
MMKEFFNEFPTTVSKTLREEVLQSPPVNITEQTAAYLVEIAAPGFDKADFNVKLENNILTISAAQKEITKDVNDKPVRREFSVKGFKRSFTLDEKIDSENIQAKYDNGILKLELPKKETAKPLAKEITIA